MIKDWFRSLTSTQKKVVSALLMSIVLTGVFVFGAQGALSTKSQEGEWKFVKQDSQLAVYLKLEDSDKTVRWKITNKTEDVIVVKEFHRFYYLTNKTIEHVITSFDLRPSETLIGTEDNPNLLDRLDGEMDIVLINVIYCQDDDNPIDPNASREVLRSHPPGV